jgi:hypothetical protein
VIDVGDGRLAVGNEARHDESRAAAQVG